jgi:hypothetical protein
LEPTDRAALQQRIAQRFDAMLAAGLLEEVEALRARSNLTPDLPALRCVGYRQAWQALDEGWPIATLRERGIIATRQLAKRQLTRCAACPAARAAHRRRAPGPGPGLGRAAGRLAAGPGQPARPRARLIGRPAGPARPRAAQSNTKVSSCI